MSVDQAKRDHLNTLLLKIPHLPIQIKALVGVLVVLLYSVLIWLLISYLGKFVVTLSLIPIIGFILLFGFWGNVIANLSAFTAFLIILDRYYGSVTSDLISLIDIIYILVLIFVAALISWQKEFILKLFRQLTHQKLIERKLLNSQEGYRNLINRVPIGLYRTTPEGKILEASPTLIEMLGFPNIESLSGVNIDEELYVNPDDRLNEQALLQADGIVHDYEMRLFRRDGEIIWVRDNVRAVVNEDGQTICYEGSLEDITRRKQMEEAEHEQRILAEALRDTAAALSSTLHFDEVLDRILTNMGHVVPHDAANIMLIEKGHARIERSQGYLYDWEEEARQASRFPIEDIPTLRCMAESGLPLSIEDTHDSDLWANLPHTEWMRSYAGAPIKVKGEMIGFLNLNSATPGFFTPTKAEWLQAFADQAAVAIDNARMFGEIHEHARQMALLNEITQATIVAPDLGEMIQTLADRLGELISADRTYITLWNEEDQTVIPGAAFGPLRDSYSEVNVDSSEKTISSLILEQGEPLILGDIAESIPHIQNKKKLCAAETILGMPLIADGNKLGAALISFDEPHHFTEEEISLSEQAARLIALAIYKAQLYESERERTEELARANALITALGHVAAQVEIARSTEEVVELLGNELVNLGVLCMILLKPADEESLRVHLLSECASIDYPIEDFLPMKVKDYQIGSSEFIYYEEVIDHNRTLFLENPEELICSIFCALDDNGYRESDEIKNFPSKSQGFLLPLISGNNTVGSLLLWGNEIHKQDKPAFSLFASQIAVALEKTRLLSRIQQLAITDELTGLYNRRGFYEIGSLEIDRTRRFRIPLAAILMDIDHFKLVNDRYSHAVGDQVLRSFSNWVLDNTREVDVVGRIGGEEFIILLPGNDLESAQKTADRLQRTIATNVTETKMGQIRITVSQGVAILDDSMHHLHELIDAADQALHKAKESGRNRVVSSAIL
jgi:diguanylate cyclase (GGDEF)-like protein/PAS domain S-box-containing protein